MTNVITAPQEPRSRSMPEARSPSEESRALFASGLKEVATVAELCDTAASRLSVRLGTVFVGVWIHGDVQRIRSAVGDPQWMPLAQGLAFQPEREHRSLLRMLHETDGPACAVMAVPLKSYGMHLGAVVAVMECGSADDGRRTLQALRTLAEQIGDAAGLLRDRRDHHPDTGPRLDTLAKSIRYSSLDEFCCSVANGLRAETDMDLVAIGLVSGHAVELKSVSGLELAEPGNPGSRLIRHAMEESRDAGHPVCVQCDSGKGTQSYSDGFPLAERWQQGAGGTSVAALPLMNSAGNCVAVLSVQARRGRILTEEQLQHIETLASPLVASLELLKSGQRNLLRHAFDSVTSAAQRISGPVNARVAAGIVITATVAAWLVLGTTDYVVRAPCTVTAARIRVLSAPWEAPLAAVLVRPGEQVRKGQLLARMDTRLLRADRDLIEARLRAAQVAVIKAAQSAVPAEIGRAMSCRAMEEAELKQVEQMLASAEIRAPFDGLIISEDLVDRTGETLPIGESLFEIVPDGELALDVQLSESVLSFVSTGQTGTFSMNASPGTAQDCRLDRIDPAAEVGTEGNVVTARASVAEASFWMRPGMQGVVRISTGERPVWWVWLHGTLDAVNHQLWSVAGTSSAFDSGGHR